MKTLVTGAAGFIGFHTVSRLLAQGQRVVGLDNLNDYYDPHLKESRLKMLLDQAGFEFVRADVADRYAMDRVFKDTDIRRVVHLAAQAGVRYSLVNPHAYVDSNVNGFLHILEGCRALKVQHLVYASTSSVYGSNTQLPYSEQQNVDHPLTLYAATKKANELMAHSYASLYGIPTTGLRFFTVYGPWGRPDMALFLFTQSILAGKPINVFNGGDHHRDFTYVDDIVEGVIRVLDQPAAADPCYERSNPDPATSTAPYRIYNIGNQKSVPLLRYIEILERMLGREAEKNFLPMQMGDIAATQADASALERAIGPLPHTDVEQGIARFVEWYLAYYNPKT